MKRLSSWLFRSRDTGKIALAQFPNVPLWGFILAMLLRWTLPFGPQGRQVIGAVALGFLTWWSLDEIVRGVNPWRRFLGATVLAFIAVAIVSRLR
jgi:hypothetical protein